MKPSKNQPTEPGLYRWHDGLGETIEYAVYFPFGNTDGGLYAFSPKRNIYGDYLENIIGGFWERIESAEPWIEPKLPEIELWEGTCDENGKYLIVKLEGHGYCFDHHRTYLCNDKWQDIERNYNNLSKRGEYALK